MASVPAGLCSQALKKAYLLSHPPINTNRGPSCMSADPINDCELPHGV